MHLHVWSEKLQNSGARQAKKNPQREHAPHVQGATRQVYSLLSGGGDPKKGSGSLPIFHRP